MGFDRGDDDARIDADQLDAGDGYAHMGPFALTDGRVTFRCLGTELGRRGVVEAAGAYLVGGFGLLQAADLALATPRCSPAGSA